MNTGIGVKIPIEIGQRFGRLTVIATAASTADGRSKWLCRCDCGVEKAILGRCLVGSGTGATRSCGCFKRERDLTRDRPMRHGHARHSRQQNDAPKMSPTYSSWRAMIRRCTKPGYTGWRLYGGRGITICQRWRDDFAAFLADVGERPSREHSLDRIDPNGNYEPGNVRWATATEQRRNTRLSRDRVTALLAKYEPEAPDVIARLRKDLLG